MVFKPVGYVVKENVVEILPEYEKAMQDVEKTSHLWILYISNLAEEKLLVHPRGDKGKPLKGVFATRSPSRPNRIGMSAVRLVKVEGRRIVVKGLDALPGSPVVDIKPYAEVFDLPWGSVLSKEEIKKRIAYDNLISDYIDLSIQLQPNGFDCTLRNVARFRGHGRVDFDDGDRKLPEVEELPFKNNWIFLPKGVYRAYLNEVINLKEDLMALGRPRSTLARAGVGLITAVWDAGYKGRSEVGLVVYNDVWLKRNARIMQLVFIKLTDETKPYSGIYQEENI
jgi:dUTP pyrophosphatase